MFSIASNWIISLTRGDTARINVSVKNEANGEDYVPSDGDIITFTVKEKVTDDTPVIQKEISPGEVIHIAPADTAGLDFGQYKYDVQLTTASGDVYTIIAPTTFKLLEEVTY